MSIDQTRDRLADVLTDPLAASGLDVEAIELTQAGKRRVLRVAVDKDGGVRSTTSPTPPGRSPGARRLGRDGRAALHPRGVLPGTDRPLQLPRHWRRNRGRLVKVTLKDGRSVDRPDHRQRRRRARCSTSRRDRTRSPSTRSRRRRCSSSSHRKLDRARARPEGVDMDIDMAILRSLEREKEISFEILVEAIEQALLTAYHKTPGAQPRGARPPGPQERARHRLRRGDRRGGQRPHGVRRHPGRLRPDRRDDREADHAAAAARRRGRHQVRRVLRQGGRHHLRGDPAGPRPQRRHGRPRASSRRCCPSARAGAGRALRARQPDQVPGHQRPQGHARPAGAALAHPTRTWSRSSSPSRCPRSPTAPSRSAPSPARPATGPRSRCGRTSRASTPRARASARWASGCAR